jgi:pimeloyl-ACP methyl ester carboxylesterase
VTGDLKALIETLALERPIVVGQSYGGQVALDFAARWPALLSGLVLVDGGFIELATVPGASWEQTAIDLKPPHLIGMPREEMVQRMRAYHPDWPEAAIEMQMGNFETRADGTIAPWLTLDRHMQILRAIWEQRPSDLYSRVKTPTLVAAADNHSRDGRWERKQVEVAAATEGLEWARVRWFEDTAHDIHVERPVELADWILEALRSGFFDERGDNA